MVIRHSIEPIWIYNHISRITNLRLRNTSELFQMEKTRIVLITSIIYNDLQELYLYT